MNKSDYDKYYKKGGTYVIPIEIFNELFDERDRLKEENEELKHKLKLINSYVYGCDIDSLGVDKE